MIGIILFVALHAVSDTSAQTPPSFRFAARQSPASTNGSLPHQETHLALLTNNRRLECPLDEPNGCVPKLIVHVGHQIIRRRCFGRNERAVVLSRHSAAWYDRSPKVSAQGSRQIQREEGHG